MSDYHNKRAAEIIEQIAYITVASVSKEGKPWNSPVARIYDDELNFYWFSDKEGQHSKNVREKEDVFLVIYDSTIPEGKGEGVYIEAKAFELNDPEEIRAVGSIKKSDAADPSEFMGDAVRRVYKAVPQRIWMNDAQIEDGKFIRDYRVEVSSEAVKEFLNEQV